MNRQGMLDGLRDSLAVLDEEAVRKACKDALDDGIPAYQALMEGLAKGMELVGKKYEEGEYFLAELVVAGEIMKEAMIILQAEQGTSGLRPIGRVIVATVKGDLHDIGKNVVVYMLRGAGFEVTDMGVDVQKEKVVEIVEKEKPDIVALSALLTTTIPEIENTVRALEDVGVRHGLPRR